jgi:hypothetical protein
MNLRAVEAYRTGVVAQAAEDSRGSYQGRLVWDAGGFGRGCSDMAAIMHRRAGFEIELDGLA